MLTMTDTFVIPDDIAHLVPCQTSPELFTDPALDIDIDDDEWIGLTIDEQTARVAAKQAAELRAKAACGGCPKLFECGIWANAMGQDVFGVAGGLAQDERPGHKAVPYITDYTERGPLGQVRDDLVERWAAAGVSNKQIAERLGCNVRTVERRRAGIAAGTIIPFNPEDPTSLNAAPAQPRTSAKTFEITTPAPDTAAASPLIIARVTDETAALFDALADGRFHDRDQVIAAVAHTVDRDTALKTAPKSRTYADSDAQAATGARKFLMNRIDIAVRRGRIQIVTDADGQVLLCLEADTARTWAAHRAPADQ
jgi:hypothetical protein